MYDSEGRLSVLIEQVQGGHRLESASYEEKKEKALDIGGEPDSFTRKGSQQPVDGLFGLFDRRQSVRT